MDIFLGADLLPVEIGAGGKQEGGGFRRGQGFGRGGWGFVGFGHSWVLRWRPTTLPWMKPYRERYAKNAA